jgi:hypothetical protein
VATSSAVAVRKFNPGKKVYWRGRWWDAAFVTVVKDVEREQGYQEYFFQGSYNRGGVSKSAGTHDKGAVGDKRARDLANRKRYARRGIVVCRRTPAQRFSLHDHMWLHGAITAAAGLLAQMYEWANGGDGLVGNRPDDSGVRGDFRNYNEWRKSLSKPPAPKPAARPAAKPAVKPVIKAKPACYLDGVNKSKKYGSKVRSYYSVKLMQNALNKIYAGTPLKVDGIFGPKTVALFDRWRVANFGPGSRGNVTPRSSKLLFRRAKMNVNVYAKPGEGPL